MSDPIDSLIDIMEHERRCLLEGRYDDLNAKQPKKEKLIAEIEATPPAEADLLRLQDAIQDLHAISEAAMRGVTETRAELERSLQARTRLATYGPGGDARCIEYAQPVVTRRA